jgi:hypothetical protein
MVRQASVYSRPIDIVNGNMLVTSWYLHDSSFMARPDYDGPVSREIHKINTIHGYFTKCTWYRHDPRFKLHESNHVLEFSMPRQELIQDLRIFSGVASMRIASPRSFSTCRFSI